MSIALFFQPSEFEKFIIDVTDFFHTFKHEHQSAQLSEIITSSPDNISKLNSIIRLLNIVPPTVVDGFWQKRKNKLFAAAVELWLKANYDKDKTSDILCIKIWHDLEKRNQSVTEFFKILTLHSHQEYFQHIRTLQFDREETYGFCECSISELLCSIIPIDFFAKTAITTIDLSKIRPSEDMHGQGWNMSLFQFAGALKMINRTEPLIIDLSGALYCNRVSYQYMNELKFACRLSRTGNDFSGPPLLDINTHWDTQSREYPFDQPRRYSECYFDCKETISSKYLTEYQQGLQQEQIAHNNKCTSC